MSDVCRKFKSHSKDMPFKAACDSDFVFPCQSYFPPISSQRSVTLSIGKPPIPSGIACHRGCRLSNSVLFKNRESALCKNLPDDKFDAGLNGECLRLHVEA